MKFLIPTVLAVAIAMKKDDPVSYSCPRGYTLEEDNCIRRDIQEYEYITQTIKEDAMMYCPKGGEIRGNNCVTEEFVEPEQFHATKKTPVLTCGKEGVLSDGICRVQVMGKKPVVISREVSDRTTIAKKENYQYTVERESAIVESSSCPEGAMQQKNGDCIVSNRSTSFTLVEQDATVDVPSTTRSSEQRCPEGIATTKTQSGKCVGNLHYETTEVVKKSTTVQIPKLVDIQETYEFPNSSLHTVEMCPQGSEEEKGSCYITMTRSHLEPQQGETKCSMPSMTTLQQDLVLSKSSLEKMYSCPKGSVADPSTSGESLVCEVEIIGGAPQTKMQSRIATVTKLQRRVTKVPISRVESYPVYYCPKGSVENEESCTISIELQNPVAAKEEIVVCPAGSEKSEHGSCLRTIRTTIQPNSPQPSKQPTPTKHSKYSGMYDLHSNDDQDEPKSCPMGSTPHGNGDSLLCVIENHEELPAERFMVDMVRYEKHTHTDNIPKMLKYETRTITDEVEIEEVVPVEENQEFKEYVAATSEVSKTKERVPAIAYYNVVTSHETVSVTNDAVEYVSCDLTPQSHRVVTEQYREMVNKVVGYEVHDAMASETVTDRIIEFDQENVIETVNQVNSNPSPVELETNEYVTFVEGNEPVVLKEQRLAFVTNDETVTVDKIPSYGTKVTKDTLEAERLVAFPACVPKTSEKGSCMLSETVVDYEEVTVDDTVLPTVELREENVMQTRCPSGSITRDDRCVRENIEDGHYQCKDGSEPDYFNNCKFTHESRRDCRLGYDDDGSECVKIDMVRPREASAFRSPPTKKG